MPEIPWPVEFLPHSSASHALKRPTPRTSSPRESSWGQASHTVPRSPSGPLATALPLQETFPGVISETSSNDHAETAEEPRDSAHEAHLAAAKAAEPHPRAPANEAINRTDDVSRNPMKRSARPKSMAQPSAAQTSLAAIAHCPRACRIA